MKKSNLIAILGGGLAKDKKGKWHTTLFNQGDTFASLGDRLRVLAGAYLSFKNPQAIIISTGGKGQYRNIPGVPPVSVVIKSELLELGVPARRIRLDKKSSSTYKQLTELMTIAKKKKAEKLLIVSNKYHFPRVMAMLNYDTALKRAKRGVHIEYVVAEDVVSAHDPRWIPKIKKAYASEGIKRRIALEKKGANDIKKGKYKH